MSTSDTTPSDVRRALESLRAKGKTDTEIGRALACRIDIDAAPAEVLEAIRDAWRGR